MTSMILILRAYAGLISHDLFMSRHDFASLHRRVKGFPLRPSSSGAITIDTLSRAVEIACCFYTKYVLCLQRSAVLVEILREKGIPARLVIGAQKLPFKAHAWVEVNGAIVNDRLASREEFLVLEVC